MWLSSEFLNWNALVEGYFDNSDLGWERAYEIWAHAEQILKQHCDDLHLVDAVTTLKRAMSHRLQLLRKIYNFDVIPLTGKPQRAIEQLAFWGIVRPTMLARLIDIRNAVEHEDATPPTYERCNEFLDLIWYFLRSTDRLTIYFPTGIEFESEAYTTGFDNTYWLVLEMGPQNGWKLGFSGWVNSSMLLASEQDGWFEVQINSQKTRDEARSHIQSDAEAHKNRKVDDLSIAGTIMGPGNSLRRIFDLYFELALIGS